MVVSGLDGAGCEPLLDQCLTERELEGDGFDRLAKLQLKFSSDSPSVRHQLCYRQGTLLCDAPFCTVEDINTTNHNSLLKQALKLQVCWEMFRRHFSITVQRNDMRFGGIVVPNTSCLSLTLGLCSSFSFGVVSVLLSRFDSLFKCTVNKKL